MNELYLPVKITDSQWTDRLLDGEIFMRPLFEFGSWGKALRSSDASINNTFRGDLKEGVSNVYMHPDNNDFLKGLDSDFKRVINHAYSIDQGDAQYLKIYSLYALNYKPLSKQFDLPDKRMKQFGDSAVIIQDMNEFLKRIFRTIFCRYGENSIFLMDKIRYYVFHKDQKLNPIFDNTIDKIFQNELRVVFSPLAKETLIKSNNEQKIGKIVESTERITLFIGDIRDIAVKIPIDDFLSLNLPDGFIKKFPMSLIDKGTMFEKIINDTKKQMSNYKPLDNWQVVIG